MLLPPHHTHTPWNILGGPAAAHGARREELPGRRALDDSARDGRQHVLRLRSVFVFGVALDAGQHGGAAAALAERSRNRTVGQGAVGPGGRRGRRKGLLRREKIKNIIFHVREGRAPSPKRKLD